VGVRSGRICGRTERRRPLLYSQNRRFLLQETEMGRGILLWLLGVPIPVIIIILLLFR